MQSCACMSHNNYVNNQSLALLIMRLGVWYIDNSYWVSKLSREKSKFSQRSRRKHAHAICTIVRNAIRLTLCGIHKGVPYLLD